MLNAKKSAEKYYLVQYNSEGKLAAELQSESLSRMDTVFMNPVRAGIHFYGEVLRTALVRRKNIREMPQIHGNPDALYYRFQIREWIPLSMPILPKESGFVYEFTNMFLLENAEYVPELLLRSEEEYRFYTELKRRTGTALENNEAIAGYELEGIKVLFDGGRIQVYTDGKEAGSCSVTEFSRQPNATFRRLQKYAEAYM